MRHINSLICNQAPFLKTDPVQGASPQQAPQAQKQPAAAQVMQRLPAVRAP